MSVRASIENLLETSRHDQPIYVLSGAVPILPHEMEETETETEKDKDGDATMSTSEATPASAEKPAPAAPAKEADEVLSLLSKEKTFYPY